ncbi:MAG: HD domain-containing protein [Chloroflexi bacterium]|nr:HD domain-containing protein [Anaerolineaceae bacterium]NMB89911.1 HD domain-containing protein [Chloroflexota bacterium]
MSKNIENFLDTPQIEQGNWVTATSHQKLGSVYRDIVSSFQETSDHSDIVLALAKATNAYDASTVEHSERIIYITEAIAHRLGCSREEVRTIRWAALLHDIGKIGVPIQILHKPGPLSESEWGIMRLHPAIGAEIVSQVGGLTQVARLIRSHHEKYNGTGYPDGLSGTDIPLGSRIITVADAFGAMTEGRIYRAALSTEEAMQELIRCSGTHFDPKIVEIFLSLF